MKIVQKYTTKNLDSTRRRFVPVFSGLIWCGMWSLPQPLIFVFCFQKIAEPPFKLSSFNVDVDKLAPKMEFW